MSKLCRIDAEKFGANLYSVSDKKKLKPHKKKRFLIFIKI